MPGVDQDWEGPFKLDKPGVNGSTVPLPYRLDPARVPMAGSYTDRAQQERLLTSAWYALPPNDGAHPLVVVTAAGPEEHGAGHLADALEAEHVLVPPAGGVGVPDVEDGVVESLHRNH